MSNDWREEFDRMQMHTGLFLRYMRLNDYFKFMGARPGGIPERYQTQLSDVGHEARETLDTVPNDRNHQFYSELVRDCNIKLAHLIERMELIKTQFKEERK